MSNKDHEFYPTPDALAECLWNRLLWLVPTAAAEQGLQCLEPSAGGGAFVWAMAGDEHPHGITAIEPYQDEPAGLPASVGWGKMSLEELHEDLEGDRPFDVACGNPPFSKAEDHLRLLFKVVRKGGYVGFLLRSGFLGSSGRAPFFAAFPPKHVYILSKRPSFVWSHTCQGCKHTWTDEPNVEHHTCPSCENSDVPISTSKTDRYDYCFAVWEVGWAGETTLSWLTQLPSAEATS